MQIKFERKATECISSTVPVALANKIRALGKKNQLTLSAVMLQILDACMTSIEADAKKVQG